MSSIDSERVVTGIFQDSALASYSGQCPLCGRPAIWAFSGRESPDRVLLEPGSGSRVSVPRGRTVVVASASGGLAVASPWVFQIHVCDPDVIESSVGDYTVDVLSHPCPVDSCLAPAGEMCVSPRYDVLPRPHGARVAMADGAPWSDEDTIVTMGEDE